MRSVTLRSIFDVAREAGLQGEHVVPWGRHAAKIALEGLEGAPSGAGRLLLVSAINPTPPGEGKTTVAVALAMGMRRLGKRALVALRQPSLGPIFGAKGGATGGGRATLEPSDDINVHFTGDVHAVGAAHNLLSSLVDNALHWQERWDGAELDGRRVAWGRVLDSEDRSLRRCVVGLGGPTGGVPREEHFDITAASEVMAVLALARDRPDLERRLARIVAASTSAGRSVTAADLGAARAMGALLRDALLPNLVQTAEGGPALVHAGPFANIAHGCSSVVATRLAMRLADFAVTEAGFGFDLGGEKFLDLKCRAAGIFPRLVVLVVSARALRVHGGLDHLDKHLESVAAFGLRAVVAVNVFASDTEHEVAALVGAIEARGVPCARCDGFARGGEGALDLARLVAAEAEATDAHPPEPRFLGDPGAPFLERARAVARTVYGARDVVLTARAAADLEWAAYAGFGQLPICFAKTHLSLSDDPARQGRPRDFDITVRDLRVAAGAGMLVARTGEISTMPGLPRHPAARGLHVDESGRIAGV